VAGGCRLHKKSRKTKRSRRSRKQVKKGDSATP
jgi:hypothetical protein